MAKAILSLVLLLSFTLSRGQECCPCGSTDAECFIPFTKGRTDVRVDGPYGSTCTSILSSLKDYDNNPSACRANILDSTYERCCGDSEPDPNDYVWLAEIPTEAPGSDVGETACLLDPSRCGNDVCDLCWRTKEFPQKWATVTASLYIPGNPTCRDLYYLGRAGAIPNRICRPLQDYYEDPCGCPTKGGSGGGSSNPSVGGSSSAKGLASSHAKAMAVLLVLLL